MDNYTFSISFLEDRSFSKITISGDMRKLLEFQTKENVFPAIFAIFGDFF